MFPSARIVLLGPFLEAFGSVLWGFALALSRAKSLEALGCFPLSTRARLRAFARLAAWFLRLPPLAAGAAPWRPVHLVVDGPLFAFIPRPA